MADKVGSSNVEVTISSELEETFTPYQDQIQQTNKEPLLFLPPLPHLHSTLPSPAGSRPSDQVYLQGAAIFQHLQTEKTSTKQQLHYGKKTDAPGLQWGDKTTQEQAYELAFNTLKYQDLLEDIITDSCFNTSQHISSDLLPLAMVMLCDFMNQRFVLRKHSTKEEKEPEQEVRELEKSLQRCKTKLAASLARSRVKQSLQSVSCFLSDPVRTKQHRAKRLPLYAWVNTLTVGIEEVCEALRSAGLCEVRKVTDLRESSFCRDPLCPDTLVFSRNLHGLLQHSSLTRTHTLNIQDRSVCVAVSVLRPLLFEKGDVMVVGSFSALTVAHVAVVASARSGRVLVCGAEHTPLHIEDMRELLTHMDIKNVKVLAEAFCSLSEWDSAVQRLKVIIVLPQCSCSALSNPVPTILSELGDCEVLPDLSHGFVSQRKKHNMANQQARLLTHALSFPKVQTVVYCTRSVYPEENEQLVKRVLEKTTHHPKLLPFRVNGPIFPNDSGPGDNGTMDSKFFRLEASEFTNGCFIARLSRQADPTKVETVQDVLARAAAKGLLGGIIPGQSEPGKKVKSKKNRAASADSKPSSPSSQENVNGQDQGEDVEKEDECVGEEDNKEEEKGGKKRRGPKGSKQKGKRRQNQTTTSKNQANNHKKKPTKKKVSQQNHKKRPTKIRRIPRLTLTLMSSANSSKHLSSITALAHKLSDQSTIQSQLQMVSNAQSPARPTPHAASKQNTQPERAREKTQKAETGSSLKAVAEKEVRAKEDPATEKVKKPEGLILPLISSPSPGSLSSRSRSLSPASDSQTAQISASSSTISLPGL